jgi:hypothetical protein
MRVPLPLFGQTVYGLNVGSGDAASVDSAACSPQAGARRALLVVIVDRKNRSASEVCPPQ